VARLSELLGEQAAPAAKFEDEPGTRPHRLKQRQDSRRAGLRVEAKTAVMHKREIAAVIAVMSHALECPAHRPAVASGGIDGHLAR